MVLMRWGDSRFYLPTRVCSLLYDYVRVPATAMGLPAWSSTSSVESP